MTLVECLRWGSSALQALPDGKLDAEVLLLTLLNMDKATLLAWPERAVSLSQFEQYQKWIQLRSMGRPVAYILKKQSFWTMELVVSEATLIPRSETEVLVETVLKTLPSTHQKVLELGTGSGAIACALAKERPEWQLEATDISVPALKIAQQNCNKYQLKNIVFYQSNWFEQVSTRDFNAIISNPPYVEDNSPYLTGDIRFEPQQALLSGDDGLNDLTHIIQYAKDYLKPNGLLSFEHGHHQGGAVYTLLQSAGYHNLQQIKDYSGQLRVSLGYRI